MKRYSTLILTLAVLLFVGASCWTTTVNVNSSNTNTATDSTVNEQSTISIGLQINKGDGSIPVTYTEQVVPGTTAMDLLTMVSQKNSFPITTKDFDFGTLITGINGLEATDNKFWLFKVNGESASVGAGDYSLQANDVIEFEYTTSE